MSPEALLRDFAAIPDTARRAFACANPTLLRPDILQGLQDRECIWTDAVLRDAVSFLNEARVQMYEHPERYLLGAGPIEVLADQIDHTFSAEVARTRARAVGAAVQLAPVYQYAVFFDALRPSSGPTSDRSRWRAELFLAAAEAAPASATDARVLRNARIGFVKVATAHCSREADGRFFAVGAACARATIAAARDDRERADAEFAAGILHLDPYTIDWSPEQMRARVVQRMGDARRARPLDPSVPGVEDALAAAVVHLRTAAELGGGQRRGRALKALLQAQWYQARGLGMEVPRVEIQALVVDALAALDPVRDAAAVHFVCRTARLEGVAIPDGTAVVSHEPAGSSEVEAELCRLVDEMRADPTGALSRAERIAAMVHRSGTDRHREGLYHLTTTLVVTVLGRHTASNHRYLPVVIRIMLVRARAVLGRWTRERLAATLVGIADETHQLEQEELGLKALSRAFAAAPGLLERFQDPLLWLYASLSHDAGANAWRKHAFTDAFRHYAASLVVFVRLRLDYQIDPVLQRMEDLAGRPDARMPQAICHALNRGTVVHLAAFDHRFGRLANVLRLASRSIMITDRESAWRLLRLSKGHTFAALFANSASLPVPLGTALETLLPQVRQGAGPAALDGVDPELLQVNPIRPGLISASDTAVALELNRRHRFDVEMHQALARGAADRIRLASGLLEGPKRRDTGTVFLDVLFGRAEGAEQALYTWLYTDECGDPCAARLATEPPLERSVDGSLPITYDVGSFAVSKFRRFVQLDPGSRLMHRTAEVEAGRLADAILGPVARARLDDLYAAGARHLAVIPHGPLHFFPFHVLRCPEALLADRWTVTYLPNRALLGRAPLATRRTGVAALGLSFSGPSPPHGLRPLAESTAEVVAVAERVWVAPLLDRDATAPAFRMALRTCRAVHVSTHGESDPVAPAFHRIFLHPSAEHDGVVHAWELLQERVDGLEMVTLSACETSLGRVDAFDNPRGLPASLLLTGAQTIIGTLWPTTAAVTLHFFPLLYEHWLAGASRGAAFRLAQEATRARFPKARDWAVFYLAGDWT